MVCTYHIFGLCRCLSSNLVKSTDACDTPPPDIWQRNTPTSSFMIIFFPSSHVYFASTRENKLVSTGEERDITGITRAKSFHLDSPYLLSNLRFLSLMAGLGNWGTEVREFLLLFCSPPAKARQRETRDKNTFRQLHLATQFQSKHKHKTILQTPCMPPPKKRGIQ